ncbi:type VI secretion system tip protein TssI/VgrG, partial [Methylobacterium sp. NPDC097213]
TPHRTIPRPRIDGLQIARIAGPAGEEIHTDAYGRVKLAFPWDRRAKGDGTDTGWVRVTQSWGGTTWGQQIIPRVGMEALVAYQEGDPDRPIVTGIAPNPNNPVPYALPAHKTKLVIRSDSYKGTGYNEISMEDGAGAENLFTHAQKDMTTKVLNDATARVDANQIGSVGANHSFEVARNQNQAIGGSRSLTVGAVGGAATAALGAAMAGLSGQTAGLLGQAMQVAMQAAGGSDSGGSGEDGGSGSDPAALAGMAASFAGLVGGGGIGGLLGGGVDGARAGVNDASVRSMLTGGGAGMAGSGAQLAGQVGQMMGGLGGVMNTLVSNLRNDSTGVAATEQVGVSKVVNVGQTFATQVGKAWSLSVGESAKTQIGKTAQVIVGQASEEQVGQTKTIDVGAVFEIQVGERFMITVGECRLQMDKSGTVTIEAPKTTIVKGGGAQFTIGPGPILYVPDLVKGGGGAPPANCLRRAAASGSAFVK